MLDESLCPLLLPEGTVLERKYRVIRTVAEGGFSVVYEGEHTALRVPIAIKVLRASSGAPPAGAIGERFAFEAQTIARLTHPDIVRVLDTGVFVSGAPAAPGIPWIVLEWLVGETLKQHLAARRGAGGRPPSECLALMRPVFGAIAHAHAEGIAHRDLKPSNIMLSRSKAGVSAKVLDFGIAKIVGADADFGSDAGATEGSVRAFSRSYAAPEQLAGSRTGPWTDVHALALIVTELLTDRPAYAAGDDVEIGRLVFDPVRPTPGRAGADVGPWEAILRRALALRGGDCHAGAGELLGELAGVVTVADAAYARGRAAAPRVAPSGRAAAPARGGETATAGTETDGDRARAPRAASRGRAAVLAGVAAALAVAGLALWRFTSGGPAASRPGPIADTAPPRAPLAAAPAAGVPAPESLAATTLPPSPGARPSSSEPPATPPPDAEPPRKPAAAHRAPAPPRRAAAERAPRPSDDRAAPPAAPPALPYELE